MEKKSRSHKVVLSDKTSFETLLKAERAKTIKSIEIQEDNCLKKY